MAIRSAEQVTSSGVAATYHDASGAGDQVSPGVLLHVVNGSASSVNVTLVTAKLFDTDLEVNDRVVAVAAGAEMFIRVPNSTIYTNSDNLVDLTWSATTTVTFAVIE